MRKLAKIIDFQRIGSVSEGYLTVSDEEKLGFKIRRSFWTYATPQNITRGRHAHHETEMVLIALKGSISVHIESLNGNVKNFILDDPTQGLYIPRLCWHEMAYSSDAIQLVLCSTEYSEDDYIRSRNEFDLLKKRSHHV